ncbi:MAG: outer membrane lipoprotein-sorting protein [Acidobacteriota bacterium]
MSEIIAAYQAFQAAQDALLINLRADARVDYHFRIGTGAPFDVTLLDKFYLDPKVGAEFEQLEFYVNGVKWRSDRIPEFPLPQPEKVLTLPLQISLDERYRYDLLGEETVDGYDCWVVEFRPLTSDETLYKGRVWIDKKTFARVQLASLETGLDPPIISNEEKDFFRPIRGPDGLEHWVVYKIKGQQLFSTAGRSLVMSREVTFTNHVINDTGFEKLHRRAYASDHQLIRDTPVGHRYLEKTADGGRRVKEELDKDNLFLLGGVFYNRSLDFPVPLAGVNYFNRDLGGRNVQTNIFFAGLLLLANLSEPDLFGTGLDASVDVWAQGFSITDRPVIDSREEESQNVDLTRQNVTVGVGLPFADYWKVKWTGSLEFQGFARDEETKGNFVLPTDTLVTTFGMTGEFNRNAWNVTSRIRVSRRSEWEPWGDPAAPPELNEFDSSRKDFVKYQARVVKDFFLPLNQRVRASVTAFGGADLDRFSKYKFDFFTNRLRGFSGAGYRYTNGATAELQYAFNLANLIRFEATVDQAHVKDRTLPNELGGDYKNFTGLGISGQTILGPNYIISLDWGIALSSGIEDFRGDQEVFITLLRILK